MHREIYQFVSDIETHYPTESLKDLHLKNLPVPFTIIDDFLPAQIFNTLVEEIKNIPDNNYTIFSSGENQRRECRNFVNSPTLQTLSNSFQSSPFILWLEKVSGIEKIIPDPHLRGAGLARVSTNSKIGLHTDFNWNDQLCLNRKVNLILYLTPGWQSEWNGDLELWNKEGSDCIAKIEPKANRLAFWNYETWLLHGHSNKISTPNNVNRDNIIQFYYTSNATWEEDPRRSKFL